VVAGLKSGGRLSRVGPEGRARAGARRSRQDGPRLGEAFLELNRALGSESDKAATLKLVQSLAQPYPNVLKRSSRSRSRRTTRDSPTSSRRPSRCSPSIAPALEAGLGSGRAAQGRDPQQAVDGSLRPTIWSRCCGASPDAKPLQSALVQVRIQQKRYGDASMLLQKLLEKDPGNHEYEFGIAMLAMQTKDWAKAEKMLEDLNKVGYGDDGVVESYLAQVAEETGRYELALERFKAFPMASADGSRAFARRRCSPSSVASTRRAAISPSCRPSRASRRSR
jgi:predicted Zn-dependent protease